MALRNAKHLTDEENMVKFNEQWLSALHGVFNAIDDFCDMYKALASFAKKYSVFQRALHC
jgi:exonuclease III